MLSTQYRVQGLSWQLLGFQHILPITHLRDEAKESVRRREVRHYVNGGTGSQSTIHRVWVLKPEPSRQHPSIANIQRNSKRRGKDKMLRVIMSFLPSSKADDLWDPVLRPETWYEYSIVSQSLFSCQVPNVAQGKRWFSIRQGLSVIALFHTQRIIVLQHGMGKMKNSQHNTLAKEKCM